MLPAGREGATLGREGLSGGDLRRALGWRSQRGGARTAGEPDGRGITIWLRGHDAFRREQRGAGRAHRVT
eukprot:10453577-Alexandrium_andersonii.AAC.1